MKQTFLKTLSLLLLALLVMPFSSAEVITAQSWIGQNTQQLQTFSSNTLTKLNTDAKALKRVRFLKSIKDQLNSSTLDYRDVSGNLAESGKRIAAIAQRVNTLRDQIENLDGQIANAKSMITNVTAQIKEKEGQIILLYEDLAVKEAALDQQKKLLSEYLGALYEQENSVTDTMGGNEEINIAKLLLSDIPVGEQLQQIRYFNIMETTGHMIFTRLENLYLELLKDQRIIEIEKGSLENLHLRLKEEENNLAKQLEAKLALMERTKGEEKIYQTLYAESLAQQEELILDIRTLTDNLDFIQRKMIELGDSFDPDDYADIFDQNTTSIADFIRRTAGNDGSFLPKWPVSPSRGISAYFHDAAYRQFFGFTHNAIDVRVPQGTVIRAPAAGVVYRVRDNGYGYSYLILAHEGGFMTVYGHVSEFNVQEGQIIRQNQILGLSGGIPGSKGAGLATTGAHLHFEMMKSNKYVDPLDYMPLSLLPVGSLPEKYASRLTGTDRKVQRDAEDAVVLDDGIELTQVVEQNDDVSESGAKGIRRPADAAHGAF